MKVHKIKLILLNICFIILTVLSSLASPFERILNDEERQTLRKIFSNEEDITSFICLTHYELNYGDQQMALSRMKIIAATGNPMWQLKLTQRLIENKEFPQAEFVFEELIKTMSPEFSSYRPLLQLKERMQSNTLSLEEAFQSLRIS